MNLPIPYTEAIETIPADESSDILKVLELSRILLKRNAGHRRKRDREVHVKSHGFVHANFEVLNDLPEQLAQGLFSRPGSYPAVIRFSNSFPFWQSDFIPDGRGLAMQIEGVQGEFPFTSDETPTQDFLAVNHPVFVARNAKDYLELQNARVKGGASAALSLANLFTNSQWNPACWQWSTLGAMAQISSQLPRHPAAYTYFSMAPIRFGNYVAKYRFILDSTMKNRSLAGSIWSPDILFKTLQNSLSVEGFKLHFQVQLLVCQKSMPIEDATVRWSVEKSRFQTVAEIHVPVQQLISPYPAEYSQMKFNVWNALGEHRPLGGINRVRRHAYPLSAEWRLTHLEQHDFD